MVVTVLSLGLFIAIRASARRQHLDRWVQAIAIQSASTTHSPDIRVILYRRQLFNSVNNFIFIGLWPLAGADS